MSDGMTDSRREEREVEEVLHACRALARVLDDCNDAAFGLPTHAVAALVLLMRRYGLTLRIEAPASRETKRVVKKPKCAGCDGKGSRFYDDNADGNCSLDMCQNCHGSGRVG